MFSYILKRLGMAAVTVWFVITLTFILMHSIPGNPFAKEGKMPEAVFENLQKHYNLDKPLSVQYALYLKSLSKLDFGPSMKSSTLTVNQQIAKGFPVSLHLGLQAIVTAVTFGVIFGVIASLNHNRWPDYLSMVFAIIGISVPSFIMATFLINYLAVEWRLFPVAQWKTLKHTILPTLALSAMPMAFIARLMRSSMLDVLTSDYIRTAKSKGLSKAMIVIKHAIRNAILPVVTVTGYLAAGIITGSFIIEKIFAIPGMGHLFVKSIFDRDYPMILGTAIFYSAIFVLLTLVVDILYTFIDPRIKLTGGK